MKELTLQEIEDVNGGFLLAAAAVAGAAYAAYEGGKVIGADLMAFMKTL